MLTNLLNKSLGESDAGSIRAETLRSRVEELRTAQTTIERDLASARSAVKAARQAVDRSEEGLVLGKATEKDCGAARVDLAAREQTVSELTSKLASHRGVFTRAEKMLVEAEQQALRDKNAELENEVKVWLLELAEEMTDYFLLCSLGADLRAKATSAGWWRPFGEGGLRVPVAEALSAWGELTNLDGVVSRLRSIQSTCGELPENARALIRSLELSERDSAAAADAQRILEDQAHKRRMAAREANLYSQPIVFDFANEKNPDKLRELRKQVTEADPAKLCRQCASEGRVREGRVRKDKTDMGTRSTIRCDEHESKHPVVSARN